MPLYWTDCFVFPHSVRSDLSSSPLGSPSSSSCPQFRSRKWNPPLQWTFPWLGLVGYKASWPNAYLTCLGFWYTWDLNCLNKTSHGNNQHFEHCSLGRANQFLQHMMGFHHNHWSHRHVHLKNSTIDRSVFSCGYIYNICYLWEHWHAHKLHLSLSMIHCCGTGTIPSTCTSRTLWCDIDPPTHPTSPFHDLTTGPAGLSTWSVRDGQAETKKWAGMPENERDCYLGVSRFESKTTNSNHQWTSSYMALFLKKLSPFICGYKMLWLMLAMDMWNQNLRSNIQLASIGNGKMMTMCLYIWSLVSSELQTQSISQLGCIMIRSFNETKNMVSGFKCFPGHKCLTCRTYLHGLLPPWNFPQFFFKHLTHRGKNHMEPKKSAFCQRNIIFFQTHHDFLQVPGRSNLPGGVAVSRSCQETPSQQLA